VPRPSHTYAHPTLTEFLLARIAEDEAKAQALLRDLEGEVEEEWKGIVDAIGPMTPDRLLKAQLWARYDGQTKRRSFARGQQIATLASPTRVLAECEAKRKIIAFHESWPTLVQTPAKFERDDGDLDNYTYRMSQEIAWLTTREYVARFGIDPPTAPMLAALALPYFDHPDYQPEWTT